MQLNELFVRAARVVVLSWCEHLLLLFGLFSGHIIYEFITSCSGYLDTNSIDTDGDPRKKKGHLRT